MQKKQANIPLDDATFRRIRKWYLIAVAAIAFTVIFAQILIQRHLNSQLNDSKVINVAGKQRALSQKLTKEVLLLEGVDPGPEKSELRAELGRTLKDWVTAHQGLQHGNDSIGLPVEQNPDILLLFGELEADHQAMVTAVRAVLEQEDTPSASVHYLDQKRIILEREKRFLAKMDEIVNLYDAISKDHLQALKLKEYLLLVFSLTILALEILFIFKPLSLQIKETISDLIASKKQSDDHLAQMDQLYHEKERSLRELKELNFVINNAALFASMKRDGSIAFISKKFLDLLNVRQLAEDSSLPEVLTEDSGQQVYLREILTSKRKHIRNEEIELLSRTGERIWLDMSIIPMNQSTMGQSVLIMCANITERKRTQEKIEELTRKNYEERMHLRKLRARQIVEGQEEERKRIAKDIHDGIGQMLTALKFNIESINLSNPEKTKEKITYLKELASDLIRGVRTATFNLTPPELTDHGLFPALQKMTRELSKLTGKMILFESKTDEYIRFDSLAETNIYRVVQEAVNNAIKYADPSYILVTINLNESMLSVVIDDDGKGFDTAILDRPAQKNSEGGMGIHFMRERINYINGRLFITSKPGRGTRVTINYTLKGDSNGNE